MTPSDFTATGATDMTLINRKPFKPLIPVIGDRPGDWQVQTESNSGVDFTPFGPDQKAAARTLFALASADDTINACWLVLIAEGGSDVVLYNRRRMTSVAE